MLSIRQKEALELLKKEEYYLWEISDIWNTWKAYNSYKYIKTTTMKSLAKRGFVNIEYGQFHRGKAVAKITEQGRLVIG